MRGWMRGPFPPTSPRAVSLRPDTIIADWLTYLNGPLNGVRANAARSRRHSGSRVNRPTGWASSPGPPAG